MIKAAADKHSIARRLAHNDHNAALHARKVALGPRPPSHPPPSHLKYLKPTKDTKKQVETQMATATASASAATGTEPTDDPTRVEYSLIKELLDKHNDRLRRTMIRELLDKHDAHTVTPQMTDDAVDAPEAPPTESSSSHS